MLIVLPILTYDSDLVTKHMPIYFGLYSDTGNPAYCINPTFPVLFMWHTMCHIRHIKPAMPLPVCVSRVSHALTHDRFSLVCRSLYLVYTLPCNRVFLYTYIHSTPQLFKPSYTNKAVPRSQSPGNRSASAVVGVFLLQFVNSSLFFHIVTMPLLDTVHFTHIILL